MNAPVRALRSIILSDTILANYLATTVGHAVRQGDASEIDRPPYVLLWRITDQPEYSLAGREPMSQATVQVDCYCRGKTAAAALAGRISDVLASHGRGIADEVYVSTIIQGDTRDRDERDREGADVPLAVVQTDYRIFYRDRNPPALQ